jgi:ParB/RepB/Spo0J family partition protein
MHRHRGDGVSKYIEIPLELVDDGTNVRTPAKRLSQSDLGLRASIMELGILQPITVVQRGKRYDVLYGHRRTAAARAVGLAMIPAIVETDPAEKPIRQLVENQHRQPVNPLDIAQTLRDYLDEHPDVRQADLAAKLGRSSYWISTKLALLDMDERLQAEVATGAISEARAQAARKATTVQTRHSRPRILKLDRESGSSASVVVPLSAGGGKSGQATIGIDRETGSIDFVIQDGTGYGVMLTLTAAAARLLGLRLTQAHAAASVAAARQQSA